MARSKRAPALFEVIQPRQLQASSSRFPLPKWWRAGKSKSPNYPPVGEADTEEKPAERDKIIKLVPQFEQPVDQEQATVAAPPQPEPPPVTTPPSTDRHDFGASKGPTGGSNASTDEKPPTVHVDGRRIQFSLNPVSLGVVFGVLVLTVFGAYQIGKGYGYLGQKKDDLAGVAAGAKDPSVITDVQGQDKSRNSRPNPEGSGSSRAGAGSSSTPRQQAAAPSWQTPVPPISERPNGGASGGAASSGEQRSSTSGVTRTVGLNYLYIVRFRPENRDDAEHARKWLAEKGINATIEDGGSMLSLVTVDGYDYGNADDKARCQQLQSRLKSLSPEYRQACKADGRELYYDFGKPELRKLKE